MFHNYIIFAREKYTGNWVQFTEKNQNKIKIKAEKLLQTKKYQNVELIRKCYNKDGKCLWGECQPLRIL